MYKNTFYWRFSNELNFRMLQSPVSLSDFVRPRFKDLFPFFIFKIYKLSLWPLLNISKISSWTCLHRNEKFYDFLNWVFKLKRDFPTFGTFFNSIVQLTLTQTSINRDRREDIHNFCVSGNQNIYVWYKEVQGVFTKCNYDKYKPYKWVCSSEILCVCVCIYI